MADTVSPTHFLNLTIAGRWIAHLEVNWNFLTLRVLYHKLIIFRLLVQPQGIDLIKSRNIFGKEYM